MLTLAQAAAQTGMARSSILRAIKRGALSGTRNPDGTWLVDPAELARAFPVNAQPALQAAHPDPVAAVRLEAAQQRIADLERALSDMRAERDDWKTQAQRLALPNAHPALQAGQADAQPAQIAAEPSRLRRAWRWMRATGCLAGAGLLLVLVTGAAGAQQQQPQQPQRECFTVEMSHSTQGNPQGSILLDRCTGKTWLLLCIRNDTAGCAFQWAPIPDATEPAAAGRTSPPAASPPAAGDWR